MRLLFWALLLFAMWLLLTLNLELSNIIVGVFVSGTIATLYTKMFVAKAFELINPYWLLIYVLVLIKNLIISNIQIAIRTLSPDMKLSPAIVAIKTELKSDWKKLLLANSITLTPGTLTLDIVDDTLYIHIIECRDMNEKEKITQEFESIISRI
jgi:multicomponent Na+:H+ antiporter subunit E